MQVILVIIDIAQAAEDLERFERTLAKTNALIDEYIKKAEEAKLYIRTGRALNKATAVIDERYGHNWARE